MEPFTRIFTATEDYFVTVPIRQILRSIYRIDLCSGNPARYSFGKDCLKLLIANSF